MADPRVARRVHGRPRRVHAQVDAPRVRHAQPWRCGQVLHGVVQLGAGAHDGVRRVAQCAVAGAVQLAGVVGAGAAGRGRGGTGCRVEDRNRWCRSGKNAE